MPLAITASFCLMAMAVPPTAAQAQDAPGTVSAAQVHVSASQTDSEARRDFVAGKIIIGRKRIEESGLKTVEEILRREPAVTTSSDGRIGLLNMPGYTQVLVDGQKPASGQPAGQLDLANIDKIEIVKSSVAEYGPYGIAGTINIVTRSVARKTRTELKAGIKLLDGRANPELSLSHNQSTPGSPLRLSAFLSIERSNMSERRRVRQTSGTGGADQHDQFYSDITGLSRATTILGSTSAVWQAGAGQKVSFSPDLYLSRTPGRQLESQQWIDGSALTVDDHQETALRMYSLPFKWSFKPGKKSQLELTLRSYRSHIETSSDRRYTASRAPSVVRSSAQDQRAGSERAVMTFKTALEHGHEVKLGASLLNTTQDVNFSEYSNGLADRALAALGNQRKARHSQRRVYVQDEWRVNDSVALNAGISGETTRFDIVEGDFRSTPRFRLWSPSLHLSKKLGNDDKRQWRASLARSFRAPDQDQFALRPQINPLMPCPVGATCGANTIDTADRAGNAFLRPERSLGLNLSYEHGIGDDSQLTVELYARQIDAKLGTAIALETVAWAGAPRYVARPANLGNARSTGINLEFELALRDIADTAPKIALRGSIGLATSRIDSLPGPDNRLDKQTPWSAKLGAGWDVLAWPIRLDVDANWTPSVWVRSSASERVEIARRFELDASAQWKIGPARQLVLGLKTRLPDTTRLTNVYLQSDEQVRRYSGTKNNSSLSLRFETTL